jgi:hypothetical protein
MGDDGDVHGEEGQDGDGDGGGNIAEEKEGGFGNLTMTTLVIT